MKGTEIKFEYGFETINGIVKKVYFLHEIPDIKHKCDCWNILPIKYVRQFTGLKSSDGYIGLPIKDAYFGDIIRFFNTDGNEIKTEIIWYELELCIGFRRLSDGFVYTQRTFNDSGYFQPSKIQFEIMGNIYENPELINN